MGSMVHDPIGVEAKLESTCAQYRDFCRLVITQHQHTEILIVVGVQSTTFTS